MKNRVAIVTGAGRGLGQAYARELARRGAKVVVNDAGFSLSGDDSVDRGPADAVVAQILADGGEAIASHHDVTRPPDVRALVEMAVEEFGSADVVVHNAGSVRHAQVGEVTLDDLRAMLEVHVVAALTLTQAALPYMAARKYGRIVLTTSQVGFYGKVDSVAYGAAKNAVIGLMHGIRLGAASHGVLVNCISPVAMTRMSEAFPQELAAQLDPQHVAAAVAWLCSEVCRLNGEVLIAGGRHFSRAAMYESRGADLAEPLGVTAEAVQQQWEQIGDMREPQTYASAMLAVGTIFDAIRRRAVNTSGKPQ
jgi:NAD(P)-dependent dehydrogenase (short-subunit alcohol dehydrogenase family)